MPNIEEIEKVIMEEISKLRNLGEHARKGSDHLYYRSISKFKAGKLKEIKYQEKLAFEVICEYDIIPKQNSYILQIWMNYIRNTTRINLSLIKISEF